MSDRKGKKKRSGGFHRAGSTQAEGGRKSHTAASGGAFWLYGVHAAKAALGNPKRHIRRAVGTARAVSELGETLRHDLNLEPADPEAIAKLLPAGAVHQGIALLCEPLANPVLEDVLRQPAEGGRLVAVLDQITDPHNEGAILRSAAAFGVSAIIIQDRHAPPESGALAKAASGALDIVPRISVVNIARMLDELAELNFWRIALAGEAAAPLPEVTREGDMAIVLGAEGSGIRRLVRERCDASAAIPMSGKIDSLNVSNAAAIAFYELRRGSKSFS